MTSKNNKISFSHVFESNYDNYINFNSKAFVIAYLVKEIEYKKYNNYFESVYLDIKFLKWIYPKEYLVYEALDYLLHIWIVQSIIIKTDTTNNFIDKKLHLSKNSINPAPTYDSVPIKISFNVDTTNYKYIEINLLKFNILLAKEYLDWYINEWFENNFRYDESNFFSIEKQKNIVINKIIEKHKNHWENNISINKKSSVLFDSFNIDLIGTFLYLEKLDYITFRRIELNNYTFNDISFLIDIKDKILENIPNYDSENKRIQISPEISYNKKSKTIYYLDKKIDLSNKQNKQKTLLIVLLENKGQIFTYEKIKEWFEKNNFIIEIKQWDDMSDYTNDIYSNINRKNSILRFMFQYIEIEEWVWYKIK